MNQNKHDPENSFCAPREKTSLGTLIIWNISKACEVNPNLNLESAIKETQQRLENESCNVNGCEWRGADKYLACALLAWQQLGHTSADSLHQFLETKRNGNNNESSRPAVNHQKKKTREIPMCPGSISYENKLCREDSIGFDRNPVGPVLKLPLIKTIMRVDTGLPALQKKNAPQQNIPKIREKIDDACCMDSACLERLTKLDQSTKELRSRVEKLARRDAERVELLERAEAAWKDLEKGYQRRLSAAEEKEDDITKLMQKMIEERNGYKEACSVLAQQLRQRGECAEQDRNRLSEVEKQVYDLACQRLKVGDEAARLDALLNEQQCKASQLDRDLQFKEEQARRKLLTLESEMDSERGLTHEAERALRFELSALKEQIQTVSRQLLDEDEANKEIQDEMELLRQEKMEIVEDLEGCKELCDGRIQDKMDELKKKRDQLNELKEKVFECKCKLPMEAAVQVKRTPSLAALCQCTPEEKFLESCSCTSLRTSLLSNFLSDLFTGLQSEMSNSAPQMPCQMLKCLEDKHNWNKSSVIKTNLRNYFSQLLVGELDIAISTSIERYHARWVGASCADACRMVPDRGGPENEGWQERALERRAQQLAAKLAEQLFKDKADQLTAKAKQILQTGPPPCECKPKVDITAAVCLVKPPVRTGCQTTSASYQLAKASQPMKSTNQSVASTSKPMKNINPNASPQASDDQPSSSATTAFLRKTHRDVLQLKVQLEDLKKESIKKEDLQMMEANIVKIVQCSVPDIENAQKEDFDKKGRYIQVIPTTAKSMNTGNILKHISFSKSGGIKKKQSDATRKTNKSIILGFPNVKKIKPHKLGHSYAINMCLCENYKDLKELDRKLSKNISKETKKVAKAIPSNGIISQLSSGYQTKPIPTNSSSHENYSKIKNKLKQSICRKSIACFHKSPSNTSIDKLLETLAQSKCVLCKLDEQNNLQAKANIDTLKTTENSVSQTCNDKNYQELDEMILKTGSTNNIKELNETPICNQINEHVSKQTEVSHHEGMPLSTESEYIGAVNLDKCNENYSNSVTCIKNKNMGSNGAILDFSVCNNSTERKRKIIDNSQIYIPNNSSDVKAHKEIHDTSYSEKCPITMQIESKISSRQQLSFKESNIMKPSLLFPNDCDYGIKFLGVTLTNVNSQNIFAEDRYDQRVMTKQKKKVKDEIKMKEHEQKNIENKKNAGHINSNTDYIVSYNTVSALNVDMKDEQLGSFNKSENKHSDTLTIKDKIETKNCICCPQKNDESKDLEVNVYHLIEDHLRTKLDDFKASNCQSSCITTEEEEKIFFAILQRVKQLILDTTKGISCKCQMEEPAEGSWNRAHNLLQEYLKIKIRKVQCLCSTSENDKDTILPMATQRVYRLIENDLKRLNDICKCKNNTEIKDSTRLHDLTSVSKKDTNIAVEFGRSNLMQLRECDTIDSNKLLLLTRNISAQVSTHLDTKTVSCNIMENKVNITDIHKGNSKNKNRPQVNFTTDDNTLDQSLRVSIEDFKGKLDCIKDQKEHINNELENKHINEIESVEHEISYKKALPYIGYTVECSCDHLIGKCRCTKSKIGKNDNIYSIWNTLTSNKLHHRDTSYIMNAVQHSSNINVENLELRKQEINFSKQPEDLLERDVNTSIDADEEIVLIDSKLNLNKTFKSITTSHESINIEVEKPDECDYDFSSKTKSETTEVIDDEIDDEFLYYPVNNLKNRVRSEASLKTVSNNFPSTFSSKCKCNVVPLCHVKMLVDNIEKKLHEAKCTCDSLCSKVCPVHSEKI